MIITKEQIKNLLPHREPFLFLDKCEVTKIGVHGIGYKKFLPKEKTNLLQFKRGIYLKNNIKKKKGELITQRDVQFSFPNIKNHA